MPLNYLLWNCLVPGKTSVGERGKSANMDRKPDECVLAFRTDDRGFRERFGLPGKRACDGVFFLRRDGQQPEIIFVELKGTDISTAAKQLGNSLRAVRTELDRIRLEARYHAVVVKAGRAPGNIKGLRDGFKKQHQVDLTVTSDRDVRKVLFGAKKK